MLKKLDVMVILVKDTARTAEFFRTLGFTILEETKDKVATQLGDFYIDFHDETRVVFQGESGREPKGLGIWIYINVDDIDAYYKSIVEKGLKPSSEPRNWPWGNREFVIRDPDGYKYTFYQEIKK
jgi:catechol 2,3-dioxygenase-like lactoylglutathione lyase family enzyme